MQLTPAFMRDNYLRAVEFRSPYFVPCFVSIPPPTWRKYGRKLAKIVEKHRLLFPWFRADQFSIESLPTKPPLFKDEWGCVWKFPIDGLQGIVVEHPLSDWRKLRDFKPPDPEAGLPREGEPPLPWDEVEAFIDNVKSVGGLAVGFMPHGFLFLRLAYLRGYLSILKDMILRPPQLDELIDMVTEYNVEVVKRVLDLGVDVVSFGDDLGTQRGLPFSPNSFREYLLPAYKRIFSEVKRKRAKVRFHTDGYVVDIMHDLISSGVDILNVQDSVNGLHNLEKLKGKAAIEADLDRQVLLPFGTPSQIEAHVKKIVTRLGSERGGLLISAEVLHDVPISNIEALMNSLEKFSKIQSY